MTRSLFILVFAVVANWADAQSFYSLRKDRSLIATLGTGTANYFGDLVNPGTLGKIRYNIVAGVEYYFHPRISARAELAYFRLSGNDALANDDRIERNLSFFSNNIELSTTATINLFENGQRYYQRPSINIYGFTGLGLLYTNPRATRQNGENVSLRPLMTENVEYSRLQPVIPYGIGIKIAPHPLYNIVLEAGYRLTFTDYLDDVSSSRYVDPSLLMSDLSREMADRRRERDPDYPIAPGVGRRGNPDNNDGYLLLNFKIQYFLPADLEAQYRHKKVYKRVQKGRAKPTRKSY
jgi:hypothetical protein